MQNIPQIVANLITEDPNIIQPNAVQPQHSPAPIRRKPSWQHEFEFTEEELENSKLLGDYMFHVDYFVGANWNPGEKMSMYGGPDNLGWPGTASSFDWAVTGIAEDTLEVYDMEGNLVQNFELTPEWKQRIIQALQQEIDEDWIQEAMHDKMGDPYEPYEDW